MTTFAAPASLAADNQTIDLWVVTELGFTKTASVDTAKAPIVHIQPYSDDHFLIISGPTTADAYATVIQLLDISGTQPHISDAAANGQTQGAGTIVFGSPGLSISGDDKIVGNCKAIVKESKTAQAFTFTATFTDGVFSISGTTNVDWNPTKLGLTTVAVDGDEVVYYDPSGDPAFGRIIRRKISALTTARVGDTRSIGGPDWANRRWWFKDNRLWWADGTIVEGDLWQIWPQVDIVSDSTAGCVFPADGDALYVAGSFRSPALNGVGAWDPNTNKRLSFSIPIAATGTSALSGVALAEKSGLIYVGGRDYTVPTNHCKVFNLSDQSAVTSKDLEFTLPHTNDYIDRIAISPDESTLYVACTLYINNATEVVPGIRAYDLPGGAYNATKSFTPLGSFVTGMTFSADGETLYITDKDGPVRGYTPTGERQPSKDVTLPAGASISGLAATPDENVWYTMRGNAAIPYAV